MKKLLFIFGLFLAFNANAQQPLQKEGGSEGGWFSQNEGGTHEPWCYPKDGGANETWLAEGGIEKGEAPNRTVHHPSSGGSESEQLTFAMAQPTSSNPNDRCDYCESAGVCYGANEVRCTSGRAYKCAELYNERTKTYYWGWITWKDSVCE